MLFSGFDAVPRVELTPASKEQGEVGLGSAVVFVMQKVL